MSALTLNNTSAPTNSIPSAAPNGGYSSSPYDEKQSTPYFDHQTGPQQPPPAYAQPAPPMGPPVPQQGPAPLTYAVALYPYTATDAGDLNLAPHDPIAVTEYMNAEWWKGRNERTGAEGIFPRSYVRVDDSKKGMAPAGMPPVGAPVPVPVQQSGSGYGNMPMDVAQGGGMVDPGQGQQKPSKLQEGGKKFGRKLGNAAIFGAGATLGSDLVNSIF